VSLDVLPLVDVDPAVSVVAPSSVELAEPVPVAPPDESDESEASVVDVSPAVGVAADAEPGSGAVGPSSVGSPGTQVPPTAASIETG
jgi:hypothetical protein